MTKTLLIVLSAGAMLLTSCTSSKSAQAAADSSTQQPTVEVTKVISKPIETTIRLPGEIQAYESVAILPKVTGFVKWIGVDRGSHAKAGEVICRLEAPEVNSQRAEASSKLESAKSQLAAVEAKLAADESTYERLQNAAKTPGVVAGNDLIGAQKAVEGDQSQVKAAKANAAAAQEALSASSDVEQYLRIVAPFDGVITERNVHPGALVSATRSIPMLRLETLQHLRVVVPVPETDLSEVPEGASVEFTVPAFPRKTFTGKIRRISHAIDEKTRTMPVELDAYNPGNRLTPGSFSEVLWPLRRSAALLVPTTAVATNLERTFVVRVTNGKAEWVDVKRGLTVDKFVEVIGDLKEGDNVAVRGSDELAPGTLVSSR